MLFKLRTGKGSVHHFTDEHGVAHFPGDVVELPANYLGLKWLEPVEEAKKVLAKAIPLIQRAHSKGIYHKNTSSRKISHLTRAVNAIKGV